MTMTNIILLLLFLNFSSQFNFLIDKSLDYYKPVKIRDSIYRIEFNYNKPMQEIDDMLEANGKELNYFRMSPDKIKSAKDIYALFLTEYGDLGDFIKLQNNKYKDFLQLTTRHTDLASDMIIPINIDKNFIKDFKSDILNLSNTTLKLLAQKSTLDEFLKDNTLTQEFVQLGQEMFSLLKDYSAAIEDFVSMIGLAYDNILSENLITKLLIEDDKYIDKDTIDFINVGKINKKIIFYLELSVYTDQNKVREYVPVVYNGLSLEDNYLYDFTKRKMIKSDYTDVLPSNRIKLDSCLAALTSDKNNTEIIEHCEFVTNEDTYTVIPSGIIFHNVTNPLMNEINEKFGKSFTTKSFPLFITYNDTFSFTNIHNEIVTVNKTSKSNYLQSDLSELELNLLYVKVTSTPEKIIENKIDFLRYLVEEYDEILVNSVVVVILIIICLILKLCCTRCTTGNVDVTKRLLRSLMARYQQNKY